jgi:hypothetical protein
VTEELDERVSVPEDVIVALTLIVRVTVEELEGLRVTELVPVLDGVILPVLVMVEDSVFVPVMEPVVELLQVTLGVQLPVLDEEGVREEVLVMDDVMDGVGVLEDVMDGVPVRERVMELVADTDPEDVPVREFEGLVWP